MRKILIGICGLLVLTAASHVCAESPMPSDVGTYQLITVNNGDVDVLYKINTKTGQVWVFGPRPIRHENDIIVNPAVKEKLVQLLAEAKATGKTVYTLPVWILTPDKPADIFTLN